MTTSPEWRLQHAIVKRLRALQQLGYNFEFAGDQNASRRGPQAATIAKATGMRAGEPDLRLYLPGGRTAFIELKTDKGRLSDDQIARHKKLRGLGFPVEVLHAANEIDAARLAEEIVLSWLAINDNAKLAA